MMQILRARRIRHDAVGDDGVGGFEEEHRLAAFGFRCRSGCPHFLRMVGEVAADAVDPAHRERAAAAHRDAWGRRSEEHTSELQSLMRISYAVFCLKKKKRDNDRKSRRIHKERTQAERRRTKE